MRQVKTLLASAFILLVTLLIGLLWTTHSSQQRNLGIAKEAKSILESGLGNEMKFKNVRFGAYTGGGGQLLVTGIVHDDESLDQLRLAVSKLKLSIPTKWDVFVENRNAPKQ